MTELTQERLKFLLTYDPESGELRRNVKVNRNTVVGSLVGSMSSTGYVQLMVDGRKYTRGRIAFFYMHGRWPVEVDHINTVRHDDRWCNIREASRGENGRNRKTPSHNKSGVHGVSWCKRNSKWLAQVKSGNKLMWQKYFDNLTDADIEVRIARKRFHGNFAINLEDKDEK